jgi:hypothetical protein
MTCKYPNCEFLFNKINPLCELCNNLVLNPKRTQCGHLIGGNHKNVNDLGECLFCNKHNCLIQDDLTIQKKIDNITIICKNNKCRYRCLFRDFNKHCEVCHNKNLSTTEKALEERINENNMELNNRVDILETKLNNIDEKISSTNNYLKGVMTNMNKINMKINLSDDFTYKQPQHKKQSKYDYNFNQ